MGKIPKNLNKRISFEMSCLIKEEELKYDTDRNDANLAINLAWLNVKIDREL